MSGKEKDSCEIYGYKEPKVRKVQNVLDGRNVQSQVKAIINYE